MLYGAELALRTSPSGVMPITEEESRRTMKTWKSTLAILCVLAAACGGGGGSDSTTAGNGSDQQGDNLPPATASAITTVPLAGNVLADCTDNGVGVIDSLIDAVEAIASLPVSLPKLSDVIAQADLANLPVLGGVVEDGLGQLHSVSAANVTTLLGVGGVPGLALLPIPAQLPVVCSSLVSALPEGATLDPATILELLGNPSNALGVIPIFDGSNNPVAVLLATVPAGLVPNSGTTPSLPGVTTLPTLISLVPIDQASTLPLVGPTLSTLLGNLLGSLNGGGLLGGNLLALLNSLL